MNKSVVYLFASIAWLVATDTSHAQGKQIYTWTDENGVVHYVDTPPDNANAVSMSAPEAYRPGTDTSQAEAEQVPGEETDEAAAGEEPLSYADQKRQEMAAKSEERRARKAELDAACNQAREQVEDLEPSRRVFFTNEQGEVERMDDAARVQRVEDLKVFISQNCE